MPIPNDAETVDTGAGADAAAADTSPLTDDQLIDQAFGDADLGDETDQDQSAEAEADDTAGAGADDQDGTDEEQAAKAAKEGDKTTEEQKAEAAELAAASKTVDADIQKFLKDSKAPRKVQDAIYREASYRQVGSVAEFRTMKEKFPTLQDMERTVTEADTLRGLDELYYDDKPESHVAFLTKLHEDDPRAFGNIAAAFPDFQFAVNPDSYMADTAQRIKHAFDVVVNKPNGARTPEEQSSIEASVKWLNKVLFGNVSGETKPDPRQDAIAQRELSLKEKELRFEQNAFQEFYNSVDHVIISAEDVATNKAVTDVLKNTNLVVSDATKGRIIKDVKAEIETKVKADRTVRADMKRLFKDGKRDAAHRQKIVDYIKGKHNLLLRPAVSLVVSQWKTDLMTNNQQRLANKRVITSRQDVTGGAGGGGRKVAGTKSLTGGGKIDYRRTSDDDILDAALGK